MSDDEDFGRAYLLSGGQRLPDELAPYERSELEALRDIHEGVQSRRRKSIRHSAAAASFGVSLACVAIAGGGGVLGVLFVAGVVAGLRLVIED